MKLFVWDFHGVLEQGNENAVLEISNQALEQKGYTERFTLDDINRLYGLKWHEFFKNLLPNSKDEEHHALAEKSVEIQKANPSIIQQYIKPASYCHEVLEAISLKHQQILISNTVPSALNDFIKSVNIEKYFPQGTALSAYPNGKNETLKEYLKGKTYDEIIIIGDTPNDMELVKVAGGKTYLYAHEYRNFKECNSDYRIHDLRDVLKGAMTLKELIGTTHGFKELEKLKKVFGNWTEMDELKSKMEDDY